MSYRISNRDVITTTRTNLHIKNEFGNELDLKMQGDGKLCISARQGTSRIALRLNQIEVQHLRELLK